MRCNNHKSNEQSLWRDLGATACSSFCIAKCVCIRTSSHIWFDEFAITVSQYMYCIQNMYIGACVSRCLHFIHSVYFTWFVLFEVLEIARAVASAGVTLTSIVFRHRMWANTKTWQVYWRRWWSTIEAKRLVLVQFVWYEFSIHTPQMGLDEQLQIGIHAMAWGLHHALAQTSSVCSNCHEVAWHQHWQIKMMWVTCISEHFLWQIIRCCIWANLGSFQSKSLAFFNFIWSQTIPQHSTEKRRFQHFALWAVWEAAAGQNAKKQIPFSLFFEPNFRLSD